MNSKSHTPRLFAVIAAVFGLALASFDFSRAEAQEPSQDEYKYNDSHFHLTNYVQEGTNIKDYVAMMGKVVKRSTLFFGIPLQQMWQFTNTGTYAPRTTFSPTRRSTTIHFPMLSLRWPTRRCHPRSRSALTP